MYDKTVLASSASGSKIMRYTENVTIKILSFGVMNLIYTANVIFQVTFSVYRMILLPEAELASTVLSYTVKLFQANI